MAKLSPVEVLSVRRNNGEILVKTDTGEQGEGIDLPAAFANLKATASRQIFLETAQYLLLAPGQEDLIPEIQHYLRPSCNLCLLEGTEDLDAVSSFLKTHDPGLTLLQWRAGNRVIPVLKMIHGRGYLERQRNFQPATDGVDGSVLYCTDSSVGR